jgi:hypothetical protein
LNSFRPIHFGTLQNGFGNHLLHRRSRSIGYPGSITLVTKFSDFARYRFCAQVPPESGHAELSRDPVATAVSSIRNRSLTRVFCRIWAGALRGHTGRIAGRDGGDLLLPLRGIECAPRLREDVRQAEVCGTTVGHDLRQAPNEAAGPEGRRRPSVSPARSRGAGGNTKAWNHELGSVFDLYARVCEWIGAMERSAVCSPKSFANISVISKIA